MKYFSLMFLLVTSSCNIYTNSRYYPSTTISSQPTVIYTDVYRPWRFWNYRPYWWSYRPNYLGNVYQNIYTPPRNSNMKTNLPLYGTGSGIYGGRGNQGGQTGGRSGPSGGRRK